MTELIADSLGGLERRLVWHVLVALAALTGLAGMSTDLAVAAPGEWSRTAPDAAFPEGIEVSPANPNTAYANIGFGGIAKTSDGGASWDHLGQGNGLATGSSNARDLAVDPTTASTVYVADIQRVFRSLDGGETFSAVGAVGAPGRTESLDVRAGAGPADTTVLTLGFGGSGTEVFRSTDSGNTWANKSGNLTALLAADFDFPGEVALHPTNANIAYASTIFDRLYRTIDLGAPTPTWTRIDAAPLTGNRIFDLAVASGQPNQLVVAGEGVFRSADAGNPSVATPAFSDRDPADQLGSFVSEIDPVGAAGAEFVAASSDGLFVNTSIASSTNWSEFGGGLTGAESSAVGIAPSDSSVRYAQSGARIFRTANSGISWTERPGAVLSSVASLSSAGGAVYAAAGQQGLLTTDDAGATWSQTGFPAGVSANEVAAAPSNPSLVLSGSSNQVRRSTDGGASFGAPSPSSPPSLQALAFDPTSAQRAFAASGDDGMFRSTDGGQTWTQSNTGLDPDFDAEQVIVVPSPTGAGPGVVYAGKGVSDGDVVYASTDGGQSWVPASSGLSSSFADSIRDFAAHPTEPETLFALHNDGLFRTTNGGGAWTELSGTGAQTGFADSIAVSPADETLALANDGQVFLSSDGGQSFASAGVPHSFLEAGDLIFDTEAKGLHAATSEAGLLDFGFVSDVSVALAGPANATVGDEVTYTATVRADGPDPATGLAVTADLPTGLEPLAATASAGSCSLGSTITCELGSPATGAPLTVTVRARAAQAGQKVFASDAEAAQADLDRSDNSDSITTTVAAPPAPDEEDLPPAGNPPAGDDEEVDEACARAKKKLKAAKKSLKAAKKKLEAEGGKKAAEKVEAAKKKVKRAKAKVKRAC